MYAALIIYVYTHIGIQIYSVHYIEHNTYRATKTTRHSKTLAYYRQLNTCKIMYVYVILQPLNNDEELDSPAIKYY